MGILSQKIVYGTSSFPSKTFHLKVFEQTTLECGTSEWEIVAWTCLKSTSKHTISNQRSTLNWLRSMRSFFQWNFFEWTFQLSRQQEEPPLDLSMQWHSQRRIQWHTLTRKVVRAWKTSHSPRLPFARILFSTEEWMDAPNGVFWSALFCSKRSYAENQCIIGWKKSPFFLQTHRLAKQMSSSRSLDSFITYGRRRLLFVSRQSFSRCGFFSAYSRHTRCVCFFEEIRIGKALSSNNSSSSREQNRETTIIPIAHTTQLITILCTYWMGARACVCVCEAAWARVNV